MKPVRAPGRLMAAIVCLAFLLILGVGIVEIVSGEDTRVHPLTLLAVFVTPCAGFVAVKGKVPFL